MSAFCFSQLLIRVIGNMKENPSLILKPGRERSLLRRHPWVFSGAIARVDGNPSPGGTVEIFSAKGEFLARAAYSPSSQIRARVWTFDPDEEVGADFLSRRIERAVQIRADPAPASNSAIRLVYAETDGLPGLIVDRYADTLVVEFLSAGAEFWRDTLSDLLGKQTGLEKIYERSDADVRELEGLPLKSGPIQGSFKETKIQISENDLAFMVDIEKGHKTGFYLDQKENRLEVRKLAQGRQVLDCFCYTGGFSVNTLQGGAMSVLSVDSSREALETCRENVSLNHLPEEKHSVLEGDIFQVLRKFRDEGRSFEMIVLDPPKFAPTSAQVEKASRGYKDINLLAFKLLSPGGILVTFSCSGGVDADLFQKIVASAALDAGVEAQIVKFLHQAPDHPIALHFPESAYLKGLVCRKTA